MQSHLAAPLPDAALNPHGQAAIPVAEWAFDAGTGQISAFDRDGRRLMAITTGPLFGARLAAAFGWRTNFGSVAADQSAFSARMQ